MNISIKADSYSLVVYYCNCKLKKGNFWRCMFEVFIDKYPHFSLLAIYIK